MRTIILTLFLAIVVAGPAWAWNDRGHMVVAELAYQRLSTEQRQAVLAILEQHPHWQEFLTAEKPNDVSLDRWAMWRAATWPDWVKHHHEQFSKPHWHYVDFPFVPPGSRELAEIHEPRDENIVTALPLCIDKLRSSTGQEKAIYLCWVLHLVGDIHQPLHCASLFDEQFPKGDHGGNDSLYRVGGHRIIKLHPFWDDLLGKSPTPSTVIHGAQEAQAVADANRAEITREEQAATTVDGWARESFALAVAYAYVNGSVIPAVGDHKREPAEVPEAPENYAQQAGLVARVCIAKAGERLSFILGQLVR